jgi:hypothetical protein
MTEINTRIARAGAGTGEQTPPHHTHFPVRGSGLGRTHRI